MGVFSVNYTSLIIAAPLELSLTLPVIPSTLPPASVRRRGQKKNNDVKVIPDL